MPDGVEHEMTSPLISGQTTTASSDPDQNELLTPPVACSPAPLRNESTSSDGSPRFETSTLFALCWALRLLNALLSKGFFQPDEYWQTMEVAHRLAYGYGYKTWEWRIDRADLQHANLWSSLIKGGQGGIRSPLYPLIFVPVYWLLEGLGLDQGTLLTLAPRVLQAVFAASTDIAVMRIAERLLGDHYGTAALFCSLSSFFNFHASTRTFSNSMETFLTAMALAWWPWPLRLTMSKADKPAVQSWHSSSLVLSLALAATACIMRPSNAVIWLTLGLHLLAHNPPSPQGVYILSLSAFISILASLLSFGLDTVFYSTPTFTPLRFLHENVLHSISLFYGSNPFHFYLTQAIPIMTWTQLPFLLHGLYLVFIRKDERGRNLRPLGAVLGTTLLMFSMIGHKEWRFLHPVLPILHIFTALSLVVLHSSTLRKASSISISPRSLRIRRSHAIFISLSLIPAIYFSTFHSIAQVTILDYLQSLPVYELRSVGFLMPCHSTPWQSHLHRRDLEVGGLRSGEGGNLWFLTCEPPLGSTIPSSEYQDQSDHFYTSPSTYLLDRFPSKVDPTFPPSPFSAPNQWKHTWPSHLVLFGALLKDSPRVKTILEERGYREVERRWNSLWHDDERRKGDVLVWRFDKEALKTTNDVR